MRWDGQTYTRSMPIPFQLEERMFRQLWNFVSSDGVNTIHLAHIVDLLGYIGHLCLNTEKERLLSAVMVLLELNETIFRVRLGDHFSPLCFWSSDLNFRSGPVCHDNGPWCSHHVAFWRSFDMPRSFIINGIPAVRNDAMFMVRFGYTSSATPSFQQSY